MTRFIMSLEGAVDLVLFAFENGQNGDILVQKAPACTIQTQAEDITKRSCKPRAEMNLLNLCRGAAEVRAKLNELKGIGNLAK